MSKGIPQPFIDDLIAHIDIVEVIDNLIPLKKSGRTYTCCCPFHQEKTPSFHVIPQKQFFYCFGCGVSGNCIKFLMLYSHLEFPDAVQYLADIAGMQVPTPSIRIDTTKTQNTQLLQNIERLYQKNLYQAPPTAVVDYIRQRGLNRAMIESFHLGYAPNEWRYLQAQFPKQQSELIETGMLVAQEKNTPYDRFRHRLIFPLHNRKGQLIGFAGRVIDPEQKPKYMNPPETPLFHKQKELYGLYQVLEANAQPPFIVVVEGYLDVIALFQHELPYAVATMGTATSAYHLNTLRKFTENLVFCFDGDDAGRQAAWRALETSIPLFNLFRSIKFLFLPEGQDPDSYIRTFAKEGFEKQLATASPLAHYFATHLDQTYGKMNPTAWMPEAKRLLNEMDEGPGKELIFDELSLMSRLDPYRIRKLLIQEQALQKPLVQLDVNLSPALKLALCLMLQAPQLWEQIPKALKASNHYPEPLNLILEQLNQNPNLSPGNLVERFRDSSFEKTIHQAMMMEHHISESQQLATLCDSLEFLDKQADKEKIELLLQKLRNQGLSSEEKMKLHELVKNKHKSKISD
jgi:DNA primase